MDNNYKIPKIIHQIWLGIDKDPMPQEYIDFSFKLRQDNPEFEYRLWTDVNDLRNPDLIQEYIDKKYPMAFITDLVRVEIMQDIGGIYLDTDVISIKPLISLYENFLNHNEINVSPMLSPQDEETTKDNPSWWQDDFVDNWFIASTNKNDFSIFLDNYFVDEPACFLWMELLKKEPSNRVNQKYIGKKSSEYLHHLGRAKWHKEYSELLREKMFKKANLK
jgi:mannosyltransferase OCH1-like enzyme